MLSHVIRSALTMARLKCSLFAVTAAGAPHTYLLSVNAARANGARTLARTFHTGAVFCGKQCHDAAAASGVAQICNLPYRRFSIGRVFSVAPRPGHCRRPAEYNSAIQQTENLCYEYEKYPATSCVD